ncbi:polyprotein of EF-Ts, chloroplastic isoform X2 [Quercus robur]|uniref:polyprotein of EF-Ts, chloroplastic isoform X2 n=1 Tax=Quercus robur TaxID=38942 RepID=UPI0021630C66|nr:polyprotein of EF-Ts, chloroplastic isoform X2 [Quercus robur]
MTPVMPYSISNISLIPGTVFATRKNNCLTRSSLARKPTKLTPSPQKCLLPLSTSIKLFPQYSRGCSLHHISRIHRLSATGTDVAVEADSPIADEDSSGASEDPSGGVGGSEKLSNKPDASPTSIMSRRSRPVRKSEMPPVKDEELVPGASFTGKVRSIQPFGAFVDFGAFTDGLVHVSRLSDSYVKDVRSIVSVGQEVKVRLVEANTETGRISLTMRERDDASNLRQRKDSPASGDKAGPANRNFPMSNQRRDEVKKSSKFVKGQDLEGAVKNMTRSGAFISLPDGEEGFLPMSEEVDEGFGTLMGNSSLQVGQEVSVRVLRISRGRVTLTMKKEEDIAKLDSQLNQGVVHAATNPFVLAFRKNKDISMFLDEREKLVKATEAITKTSEKIEEKVNQSKIGSDEVQEQQAQPVSSYERMVSVPSTVEETIEEDEASSKEADVGATALDDASTNIADNEDPASSSTQSIDSAAQTKDKEAELSAEILAPEENMSTSSEITEEASPTDGLESDEKSDSLGEINDEASSVGVDLVASTLDVTSTNVADDEKNLQSTISSSMPTLDGAVQTIEKEAEVSSEISAPEGSVSTFNKITEEASQTDGLKSDEKSDSLGEINDEASSTEVDVVARTLDHTSTDVSDDEKNLQSTIPGSTRTLDNAVQTIEKEAEVTSEISAPEGSVSTANQIIEQAITTDGLEIEVKSESSDEISDQILSSEIPAAVDIIEGQADVAVVNHELQIQAPSAENELPSGAPTEDNEVGPNPDKNGSITSSGLQPDAPTQETKGSQAIKEVVESSVDSTNDAMQNQKPAAESEIPSASQVEDDNVEAAPEKNGSMTNSNGHNGSSSPKESITKAAISPALVKQLREETGAGMMDCKKALSKTGGDVVKAQEFLRKKGLASAEKKASRATAEGRIGSYIHDSRIGVLVEVNCETDFVSRGDIFKELVDDLAMQVAACPQVQYLVTEDVPKEIVNKEREIEMQKEDLLSKPEQIRSKIVEGRIRKRLEELALLEQPYIKNDKMVVKDWVKQTIATIGENIKVTRFVRYNLGEGLEKKSQDFAAEVAAQTAAKAEPKAEKEQPAPVEAKETVQKQPTVTVSATLVKQLREETGAGMMDCKKALSETGGDLEKAQEYLRKKGLSAADKKSSRLAAEGRIGSYIHDARIGVLIEVNSETDFVGRSEKFKELVDDLAMQIVACPQVQFVSIEDIPKSIVNKEKELEMQREDLLSKPENIREKIVEGRISKRLGELALLEQPFIKNDGILVKDLVKQTVAEIGENIKVRRFVRFTLGEKVEENAKAATEA